MQPDGGPKTDRTVVRLDLAQPVAAGASTTLDIGFFDQLPRVSARTGYYGTFHLIGQWFPKIAVLELPGERGATAPRWNAHEMHLHSEFYADYGSYDVRLTVPKGYTVGATGEETAERLAEQLRASGCDTLNVRVHLKGLSVEQVNEQIDVQTTSFLPHLRKVWS